MSTKTPTTEKKKRAIKVPAKAIEAAGLMILGKADTITDAAQQVGMSREHLSRLLNNPQSADVITAHATQRLKTVGFLKAIGRVEHLATKAASERLQFDASTHIMSVNGVSPAQDRSQAPGAGGVTFNLVFQHQQPPQISTEPTQVVDVTPDREEDQ